ncbi:type VII secretion protein EccB [Kribbella sp. ALI-6-A]|uniref:type VII secretion protein EccB n=1 Tax=Kribbella sp. ALI-6-A TaxID=1933817 RepID=UPI00097C8A4B|nr:type VII secretion protein EccB [Kribbella sp. ALI-6-A]ONI67121.1 type VII secretion protein EccB [Kribbella sp. ALI-6-A]
MASKRDQLQSYQFLVQRVVSALVVRETDPEQPPFRKPAAAALGSVALAILVLAGFGIFGLISPGGKNGWRDGESIIVEKETGTRFVYAEGRLHPVTNYVSALLALNRNAALTTVSRKSLADVPRGPRIGIGDAPDSLPGPSGVLTGSWSICSVPDTDETGAPVAESVLMVGTAPGGGRQLGGQKVGDALLVAVRGSGDQYLLWNGYRHRIAAADAVTLGPVLRSEPWATIGSELVDALPLGEPLRPIRVAEVGQPSRAVPSKAVRAGQVLVMTAAGGSAQYFLAERDALRPISELQYEIQLAFAPTATAYGGRQPVGVPLGLMEAGRAKRSDPVRPTVGQLPDNRPEFVTPPDAGPTMCATFEPGQSVPRLSVDVALPARDERTATAVSTSRGTRLADRVVVPPGRVALVETMSADSTPAPGLGLVSDLGIYYPLAGADVLETLGYAGSQPVRMPASLVARLPTGSPLDPSTARRPVPTSLG